MAEYKDLNRINQLYEESRNVAAAIKNIDEGGTVSSMTFVPKTDNMSVYGSIVSIMIDACPPEALTAIRNVLVDKQVRILTELQELGVTASPEADTKKEVING